MIISNEILQSVNELLLKHNNIVIFNHMNPDGDTIGASLAVYNVLKELGKNPVIVSPNEFPDFLLWIQGAEFILDYSKNTLKVHEIINNSDLLIYVDFNKLNRTGDLEQFLFTQKKPSILIDHHPDPDFFADIVISDHTASSASELVYEVLVKSGFEEQIKIAAAEAIYCGMITDTGRLNHNSSKPDTFRVIASLLEKGIDKDSIHERIFNVNTFSRLQLLGKVLCENTVYLPEYNAAYMFINLENQKKYNFQPGDSEGIVNYPLTIKGVRFCAMFTENRDITKVSLRSKGDFPANLFSQDFFNGGGHKNAAGGRTQKSLNEAIEIFIEGLKQYKDLLIDN